MNNPIVPHPVEFVTSRREVGKLSAKQFYSDCLEEYLPIYQASDVTRRHWTVKDFEIYTKKVVSNYIVKNEFDFTAGKKKLVKKHLIGKISEETGLPPLAIQHIHDSIYADMGFDSKGDAKNFVLVNIYNDIDEISIAIGLCQSSEGKAKLQAEKTRLYDLLAKCTQVIESSKGININTGSQAIDNSTGKAITSGMSSQEIFTGLQNLLPKPIEMIQAEPA
jgi:hypothetical protein